MFFSLTIIYMYIYIYIYNKYIYIYNIYIYIPAQKIHIIGLRHVRKSGLLFAFCQRTWHWTYLVFTMSTLKKTTTKVYFLQYDICIKTLCTTLYLSLHLNVSATVNTMTFIKDILESNYKIMKRQRFGL